MIESNKSSNHAFPPNAIPTSSQIQPITIPTRSILPIPYHNRIPRSINHLIEDYLLHNLTNPQTLTLNQGVVSIQYMTNSVYIGQIQSKSEEQQQKAGKGIYKYANNQVYMGDWKNGNFNGLGMYIFSNGDAYQGLFYNGQSTKGVLYYANGDIYEGQFKDGLKHGQGNMKYYDSLTQAYSQYSGNWKKGYKHGIGIYSSRQSQIKGNWEADKINGQVTIKSFQNIQLNIPYWEYQGIMSGNQLVKGSIKIEYKKGLDWFEGDIYKGKLEGKGKFVQKWQSGQCYSYEAEFKQGKIQQNGIMKKNSGNKSRQTFDNILLFQGLVSQSQQIDGNGKIIYGNQDKYQGLFKAGLRCGQGVYQFRNGNIYMGQFKDDRMQGKGRYFWPQLNLKYSGVFENNQIKLKQEDDGQKISKLSSNQPLTKNTSNKTSQLTSQVVKKMQKINWTYVNNF